MFSALDVECLVKNGTCEDSLAWQKFTEKFSRLIYWAIRAKIKKLHVYLPETEINDISQQILLSIWQKDKLRTVKDPKNISKWLITVAQNQAYDYIKNSRIALTNTDTIEEIDTPLPFNSNENFSANELAKEIETFIGGLALKERRIATLSFIYDLKYTETAKIVNLPMGTVANVLSHVKTNLKQYLLKKGLLQP